MPTTNYKKKPALPNNLAVKLFPLTPHQQEVKDHPSRFKVVCAGRRFGKSMLGKEEALDRAINLSQKVWFVSPTYNNLQSHWREVKRLIGDLYTYKNEQQHYIEWEREDGRLGSLTFKSSDRPDNLRGEGLDYIVLDEAAFQDGDMFDSVLRPMLSDREGGALFISSPNGTQNWFFTIYNYGNDPLDDEWMSFKFRSIDNPHMKQREVDKAKKKLPELVFKQEYLAEFVSDAGGVFHGVEDCATSVMLTGPEPNHTYYAGIDWGRKNDFTVISIFDDTGRQVRIERFTEIGWAYQSDKVVRLDDLWKFRKIYVETNSAGAVIAEGLAAKGLPIVPVYMTNVMKTSLVEKLATNIEQKIIELLEPTSSNAKVQIGELLSYNLERSKNGLVVTYNAPKGAHDDTVVATMIVNQMFYKVRVNRMRVAANPFYGGNKKSVAKKGPKYEDAQEGWYDPDRALANRIAQMEAEQRNLTDASN